LNKQSLIANLGNIWKILFYQYHNNYTAII